MRWDLGEGREGMAVGGVRFAGSEAHEGKMVWAGTGKGAESSRKAAGACGPSCEAPTTRRPLPLASGAFFPCSLSFSRDHPRQLVHII